MDLMDLTDGPIVLLDYESLEPTINTTFKSVTYQPNSARVRTPRGRAHSEKSEGEYTPDPDVRSDADRYASLKRDTESRKRRISKPEPHPQRRRQFRELSPLPSRDLLRNNRYRRCRDGSSSPRREFNWKAERLRLAIIDADIHDFTTSRDNLNRVATSQIKAIVSDDAVPEDLEDTLVTKNYLSQLIPDEAMLCWHYFSKRHCGFTGCRDTSCRYFYDPLRFLNWVLRLILVEMLD
jgi:hypothetical protein